MNKISKTALAIGVAALLAVSSFAAGSLVSINVDPSIKILVNGKEFQPKDASGNDAMTFTYNGTTYAPLRALAEAYGLEVGYDANLKMATVSEPGVTYDSTENSSSTSNFETKSYSGTGDSVIEIETPKDEAWVLYVEGNEAGKHFAVKGYDESGNYTELFVNTTDPYSGVTFDEEQSTTMLEINSKDDWYIEVRSYLTCDQLTSKGEYSGFGDTVFVANVNSKTADISGNSEERHFAVKSYDKNLNYLSLLVNTTDKYSGTVLLRDEPVLFVVTSKGEWKIKFN